MESEHLSVNSLAGHVVGRDNLTDQLGSTLVRAVSENRILVLGFAGENTGFHQLAQVSGYILHPAVEPAGYSGCIIHGERVVMAVAQDFELEHCVGH